MLSQRPMYTNISPPNWLSDIIKLTNNYATPRWHLILGQWNQFIFTTENIHYICSL